MQKFTHLHAKIRSVRRQLGLQQKEFIVLVSEKMGLPRPLTPGLASQWESNLIRSRTTPLEEQLVAIAELSKDPWRTMAWFMNDDLPADRDYQVHPDGTFDIEPDYDDGELDTLFDHMKAEHDEYENREPATQLVSWRSDPKKLPDVKKFIDAMNAKRFVWKSVVHTEVGQSKSILPRDFQGKSKVMQGGLPSTATAVAEGGLPSIATAYADGGLPSTATPSVEGALTQVSRHEFSRRRRLVGDLVTFKTVAPTTSFEGDMVRGNTESPEQQGVIKRRDAFTGAMEYALIEDHDIHDTRLGLNKRIISGALFQKVSFFSHGVSVQIHLFEANMPLNIIPQLIHRALADLLLVDRMQNRSAKKMFLLCSSEKRLDLSNLEEYFADTVQSAGLLGIKIKFAVGPDGAAQAIADLIKSNKGAD